MNKEKVARELIEVAKDLTAGEAYQGKYLIGLINTEKPGVRLKKKLSGALELDLKQAKELAKELDVILKKIARQ